jgi:hypothetical protein
MLAGLSQIGFRKTRTQDVVLYGYSEPRFWIILHGRYGTACPASINS